MKIFTVGVFPTWWRNVVLPLLFCCAAGVWAASNEPFAGVDDKWRHYQSPNFELFSRIGDESSRRLLNDFELLRAYFFDSNKLAERMPLPLTIYAFGEKRDFDRYRAATLRSDNITGVYLFRPDRASIMIAPAEDPKLAQQLNFHEFIHHLFRVTGYNPPMWINEGMAELFATIEIKSDSLVFGRPSLGHVRNLQRQDLMPIGRLLNTDSSAQLFGSGETHTGVFYGQSWALLHYWYFGDSKLPQETISKLVSYLIAHPRALNAQQLEKLFTDVTGKTYAQMEVLLDDYIRSGRYRWGNMPKPQVAPPESYAVRRVERDEIRERLAELALRSRRDPAGKLAMLQAASGPRGARALEALGGDALVEGDPDGAQRRWQDAMAAGSTNPAIYHQVAIMESRRWFDQFDYYFRLPDERATQLRDLLHRSIKFSPLQSDAYEMLAWVEASSSKPVIANVNLVQSKYATLDDQARTLLALALVRLRLGDRAGGEQLLAELEKSSIDLRVRTSVESVRAILEGRQARRMSQDETPGSQIKFQVDLQNR